ncbi:MAG TPA: response regulator [Burkholderiaceae bacterium]|jgi:two-component system LytT family response regulator
MRVLIVDDEAPARAKLRRMLGLHADVEIVGEAVDGAEALALVARLAPDVVFIDVQMPEVDGFDVAASLPDDGDDRPALVFVTAFDHYALQAFDARAADYLLKPVAPERLERALQRLRGAARKIEAHDTPNTLPAPPTRLLIPDRGRTEVVAVADIAWLQSADNYVDVHAGGRTLLMRRTLAALLADLGPGFIRIHRGAAVALAAVHSVRPRGKGDAIVVLRDGSELACSRQHRAALVERLGR